MFYWKDSFIVSSFFVFIHNMALLQGLVAITAGVGVKNPKKLPSFPEISSRDIYPCLI